MNKIVSKLINNKIIIYKMWWYDFEEEDDT